MIIYAKQPVFYVAKHFPELIEEFYVSKELNKNDFKKLKLSNVPIRKISAEIANKMTRSKNHQNVLAKIKKFSPKTVDIKGAKKVLVLVGVTDTANIGNIIRTSYALGFDGVFISAISSFSIQGAIRASSGAIFSQAVEVFQNVYELINILKTNNFVLIGTSISQNEHVKIDKKVALFLGSENIGLPNKVIKKMDTTVSIKMEHGFDSLNVGNAAAILMDRINHEKF